MFGHILVEEELLGRYLLDGKQCTIALASVTTTDQRTWNCGLDPNRSAPEFRLRQSRTEHVQALWAGARNPQELVLGVRTTRDTALSLPLDVGELRMALGHLRKQAFALVADGRHPPRQRQSSRC